MICRFLFLVLERIADRYPETGSARAAELNIVVHFIQMRFRPDENFWGHIQPDGGAKLSKEVIAAHEIRTAGERALKSRRIKSHTLSPDSRGKFQLRALPQWWCIHGIHVIEKGPERQLPLVKILVGAESRVKSDSQIVKEKKIQAKRRICASPDGLQIGSAGWASQPGNAERKVKLLRLRRPSQQKDQCEYHHHER